MPMNPTTLATELKNIVATNNEADITEAWAEAYTKYMLESDVLGIAPASASVFATAKAAMKTAMVGISGPNTAIQAAQLIIAAIKAYWATTLPLASTIWLTAPLLVPAPFTMPIILLSPSTELSSALSLSSVFLANTSGSLSKNDCYSAIVSVLHPVGAGATVTQAVVPTPVPGIPIL